MTSRIFPPRRLARRALAVLVVATLTDLCLPSAGPGALARLTGGSGYGMTTSSYRPAKLIRGVADPAPGSGSATVSYDPTIFTLRGVFNEANYQFDPLNSFIGIKVNGVTEVETLYDYSQSGFLPYFATPAGFVQVNWSPSSLTPTGFQYSALAGSGGTFSPDSNYSQIASAGKTNGAVVFGVDLSYTGSDPGNTNLTIFPDTATYPNSNYNQANSSEHSSNSPDYLTDPNDPNTANPTPIPPSQISPATVVAPEPAGLTLLALAAAALAGRTSRRRGG